MICKSHTQLSEKINKIDGSSNIYITLPSDISLSEKEAFDKQTLLFRMERFGHLENIKLWQKAVALKENIPERDVDFRIHGSITDEELLDFLDDGDKRFLNSLNARSFDLANQEKISFKYKLIKEKDQLLLDSRNSDLKDLEKVKESMLNFGEYTMIGANSGWKLTGKIPPDSLFKIVDTEVNPYKKMLLLNAMVVDYNYRNVRFPDAWIEFPDKQMTESDLEEYQDKIAIRLSSLYFMDKDYKDKIGESIVSSGSEKVNSLMHDFVTNDNPSKDSPFKKASIYRPNLLNKKKDTPLSEIVIPEQDVDSYFNRQGSLAPLKITRDRAIEILKREQKFRTDFELDGNLRMYSKVLASQRIVGNGQEITLDDLQNKQPYTNMVSRLAWKQNKDMRKALESILEEANTW